MLGVSFLNKVLIESKCSYTINSDDKKGAP